MKDPSQESRSLACDLNPGPLEHEAGDDTHMNGTFGECILHYTDDNSNMYVELKQQASIIVLNFKEIVGYY
jgi:hypothetical protein